MLAFSAAAEQLVAEINAGGVRGKVTFTQDAASYRNVTITVSLQGLPQDEDLLWEIHDLPVPFVSPSRRCSASAVGGRYDPDGRFSLDSNYEEECSPDMPILCQLGDLTGRHGNLTNGVFMDDQLELDGAHSIAGRSLVINRQGGIPWICASISYATGNGTEPLRTAYARLQGLVNGEVVLRQSTVSNTSDTSLFVKLRGSASLPLQNVTWSVYSVKVRSSRQAPCLSVGELFDPLLAQQDTRYQSQCNPQSPGMCAVGDLTGKYNMIQLSPLRTVALFFTDTQLPLSGPYSIVQRSIVIHNSTGSRIACATINVLPARSASASFDYSGILGAVHFSQLSPWDATVVTVQLDGLRAQAGGYHVHEFPVPVAEGDASKQTASISQFCSSVAVGGHWNPFLASARPSANATQDLFEVGDLSGKFGGLQGKDHVSMVSTDWYLPLYGTYSIVGRSVVIHHADQSRWTCATILPEHSLLRTAVAQFTHPVAGSIHFVQDTSWPSGETFVLAALQHADRLSTSAAHAWHVHISQVDEGVPSTASKCLTALGHYNPFKINTAQGLYACSADEQLLCELGDLSGKSNSLTLKGTLMTRFFYTDTDLPLSGAYSIINRSIVIHDANGSNSRLACANIAALPPQSAEAVINSSGAVGRLAFSQITPFSPTKLSVLFSSLQKQAKGYHVHELPASQADCTAANGHFNPFGVQYNSSPPVNATIDKYEMGDLSAKFVSLEGKSSANFTASDPRFLPLTGPLQLTSRTIVVHRTNDSRWLCSPLVQTTAGSTIQVTAVALLNSTQLTGRVTMQQPSINSLSPTTLLVELQAATPTGRKRRQTTTDIYSWYISSSPVPANGDCSGLSASDPNQKTAAAGYGLRCSPSTQVLCSSSDLTGKHGNLSLSAAPRFFFVDLNLPLSGSSAGKPAWRQ